MCIPAALILAAAVSWLAPPAGTAEEAGPSATASPALSVEGIVVRDEAAVEAPGDGYVVLAAEGERVAASGALLAYADTREGLVQAVRDAARQNASVQRLALREAARAAATDEPGGAFLLQALYAGDTGADYGLVTAPESALWSAGTDGLEHLTPAALEDISVSGLRSLLNAEPETYSAAGKLVYSDTWRFAALFPADRAPGPGSQATLTLDGVTAAASVEYVSDAYGGERAVVLVSREGLAGVLGVRRTAAECIIA